MNTYDRVLALSSVQRDILLESVLAVSDSEIADRYDDMLDDCYGPVNVAGYEYSTAELLAAVDPVAYHCGLSDFTGDGDYVEIDGEYYYAHMIDEALDDIEANEEVVL